MLLTWLLALILISPTANVYSQNIDFFNVGEKTGKAGPERINEENIGVKVGARRFAVIDVESARVLLQKDSNLKQPIASITKLMTALVILDLKPEWQKNVEMSASDETAGAYAHIYRGEQVRFIDLWKAALITSDNNSINAMIRALDYAEGDFVALMNKKARELRMANSSFVDPTGINPANASTALDVARLVYVGMQKNEIRESVLQPQYSFKILNNAKTRKISNTDVLVSSFLNKKQFGYELIGGKTGYLDEAGYCLAAKISKDNHLVIIVVLNADSVAGRFQDVKAIADWIYDNYQWKNLK